MQKWYRTILFVLGTAAVVAALAACGTTTTNTPAKLCNGQISIASEFPTTGTDGAEGKPAQNAVELAVKQASISGYTLSFIAYNDVSAALGKHDPDQGAKNVQDAVANKCILGVVGPFNSSVAKAEIPVASNAGLVLISPANTNPGLTIESTAKDNGIDFATLHPPGKPEAYFRIPGNDVSQGTVDADLAVSLGAKKIYVVDDQETYGVGIANYFEQELTAKGGTKLGRDGIPANGAAQIPGLAQKIAATKPDAVFFGGVVSGGGGTLKAQLVQAGYTGPYVGGDGIVLDPEYIKQAGAAADGTYASNGAPDPSTLTTAAASKFFKDYTAGYPTEDSGAYRANSFDAANVIIAAIKSVVASGKDLTRAAVITAVQNIKYTGVTGQISFDKNGDNAGGGVWAFYTVKNGQWVFLKQVGAGS
jgi:branched-chain amino acid transport system substrate-binding protein